MVSSTAWVDSPTGQQELASLTCLKLTNDVKRGVKSVTCLNKTRFDYQANILDSTTEFAFSKRRFRIIRM